MKPRIHSIETLGALDGPGIRTVIFFQGCPLRCGYCHNADTFLRTGGEEKSVAELVDFCLRYQHYYTDEGGVTLSGGEPLFQREAAGELLCALSDQGIHTALDTSGAVYAPEILEKADLVILDIKHTDPVQFQKLTGLPIENTIKTLGFLQNNHRRFWIRQVIVPGFTDSEEQISVLKHLCAGAEKIELLPLHHHGKRKWEALNLSYPFEGVSEPPPETMEKLNAVLRANKP